MLSKYFCKIPAYMENLNITIWYNTVSWPFMFTVTVYPVITSFSKNVPIINIEVVGSSSSLPETSKIISDVAIIGDEDALKKGI